MQFWQIGRRRRRTDAVDPSAFADPAESGEAEGVGHAARRDLLGQIGEFLLRHRLEVSSRNLVISHAAFSGGHFGLGRHIAQREIAGQRVTQAWLDDAIAGDPDFADRQEELDRLSADLEQTLASFGEATRQASKATARYGVELSQHAAGFESGDPDAASAVDPVELTRSMLERTRQLEAEMKRSEKKIAGLRNNLARARREAEQDHLTGLPNRRAFEAVFAREYREAQASVESLTIAICDIDRFKAINDDHGHEAGDRVIRAIGQALACISDDKCHIARHGGEEFVMLFRGLALDEAKERLDRVRESFAQRNLINRETDRPIGHVTFSGGVANVFHFPNPRDALAAADRALYRAKDEGRNRICLAA